jgi:F-box and leucine-rich repeat protein GRR1
MKRLELAGCTAFAEDTISHFSKCTAQGLTYLDLTGSRFLAETFCRSFKTVNLSKLETLILAGCTDLNETCLVLLSQSAVNLKTVSLANCTQLNDEAIHALAQHCKKLEHLDLTKCAALRSKSLAYLGSLITTLKSLVINECTKIYNDPKSVSLFLNAQLALEKLCAKFTRLDDQVINQLKGTAIKEIDLEGTSVTKSALLQFVTHNNNLHNFCVNNCHGIDDQVVVTLAKNSSKTLRCLAVSGGKNFTEKGTNHVERNFTRKYRLKTAPTAC